MPEAESGKVSGSERIGNIHLRGISRYGMDGFRMITSSLLPAVLLARHATEKKKSLTDLREVRQAWRLITSC
jgi:hypothetical protein